MLKLWRMSKPATKRDIQEALHGIVGICLNRNFWKVLALQVTLIGIIAGAQ
jgi:hypothetical protein